MSTQSPPYSAAEGLPTTTVHPSGPRQHLRAEGASTSRFDVQPAAMKFYIGDLPVMSVFSLLLLSSSPLRHWTDLPSLLHILPSCSPCLPSPASRMTSSIPSSTTTCATSSGLWTPTSVLPAHHRVKVEVERSFRSRSAGRSPRSEAGRDGGERGDLRVAALTRLRCVRSVRARSYSTGSLHPRSVPSLPACSRSLASLQCTDVSDSLSLLVASDNLRDAIGNGQDCLPSFVDRLLPAGPLSTRTPCRPSRCWIALVK